MTFTGSTLDIAPRNNHIRGAVSNADPARPPLPALPEPSGGPVVFFLGTHQPGWLATTTVPLFISDRRLRGYRRLPHARGPWALDSGGFTELATHGSWDHGPTPAQYTARIRRYRDTIGQLAWAAPQDWMCEPQITAATGLSVAEHQRRTVANYLQLRQLAPELPIVPVVQGWTTADYLRCVDLYTAAGVDLTRAPLVGVGSLCRRQATSQTHTILTALHDAGLRRLHGFGIKVAGLRHHAHLLTSADSMAWSAVARRQPALPGCLAHRSCANCPRYAHQWRQRILTAATGTAYHQPTLFPLGPGQAT